MSRNSEREGDYAINAINSLVAEIERLEAIVEELQTEISAKESKRTENSKIKSNF